MGKLDGKVALITGGARCMGAAHARLMSAEGAKVVITYVLDDEGRGLTKSAALDLGQQGIRVVSIYPGPIKTPMTDGFGDEMTAQRAIPRFGLPEEVAAMALFLAAGVSVLAVGRQRSPQRRRPMPGTSRPTRAAYSA